MFSLMVVTILIQEQSTDDHTQLTNTLNDLEAHALALLLFLLLGTFMISIGMGSIPWILLGEWPNIQNKVLTFFKISNCFVYIYYFSGYCQLCWNLPLLFICSSCFTNTSCPGTRDWTAWHIWCLCQSCMCVPCYCACVGPGNSGKHLSTTFGTAREAEQGTSPGLDS